MSSERENTWATYQAAWRDISDKERRTLLDAAVEPDVQYLDPVNYANGREELIAHIAEFRQSAPGTAFTNHRFLDHHEQAIANWTLSSSTGEPIIEGASHATFNPNGRLAQITGFFP